MNRNKTQMNMNMRNVLLALAAIAVVACGQSAEEKVKAYEEAHDAMMEEYSTMMDSLSTDPVKAEAFYNEFVERYIDFNLEAAKKTASELVEKLRGGDDFAAAARQYSRETHAKDGGSWGYIEPQDDLRKELADAIAKLGIGAVSDPVVLGEYIYILRKLIVIFHLISKFFSITINNS